MNRWSCVGALFAAAALSSGCGSVCLSDSQCPSGNTCVGGSCSPTNPRDDQDPNVRPQGDGGVSTDGGTQTSSSGTVGSSSSSGGTGSSSSGTTTVEEMAPGTAPTAIALTESGTELWLARQDNVTAPADRVEKYALPLPTQSSVPISLTVGGDVCRAMGLVVRGTLLYAACGGNTSVVRVFNTAGVQQGTDVFISAPIAFVDHASMVGFAAGAAGTESAVFTSPGSTPQKADGPGNGANTELRGMGLIETSGAISAGVVHGASPAELQVLAFSGSFQASGTPVSIPSQGEVLRVVSGRRNTGTGGIQPVLVADANGSVTVWDGPVLAQGGAPAKTFAGMTLGSAATLRIKVRNDGKYAYVVTGTDQVCRLDLSTTGATTPDCRTVVTGCTAVDVAPAVGGSATYVACSGTKSVRAMRGF